MKRRTFSNFLVDVLTIASFVLMFVSQFRLLSMYNYLCLGCVMALFLIIMTDRSYKMKQTSVFTVCMIYVLWTSLFPLLLGHSQMFNRYVSLSEGFIFFLVYKYNGAVRGHAANKRMMIALLVILLYPTAFTLLALAENGSACRSIKSSFEPGDSSYYYFLRGVLGYELIYSTMLMSIALFGLYLFSGQNISKKLKIIIIAYIALFTILVVMSNYFTATVLLFLGYVLVFVLKRGAKTLVFLIPLIMIYAIGKNTINEGVMNVALTVVPEGKTHDRIELIKNNIGKDNDDLEELDSREETNERSIGLIFEYPIAGYIADGNFFLSNVGQHSYVLDTMGLYGIPIGLLGCYAMILPIVALYRREKNGLLKRFCLIVGCMFFFLLFRNNTTVTIGCSAYFFIPTIYSQLKEYLYEKDTHRRALVQ